MKNYFRITTYSPEENISAIVDCYGKFDQVWQFSAYLVKKNSKSAPFPKNKLLSMAISRKQNPTMNV